MRKVAFVTGAGKVTGKAIALKLGESGYDVGISYVNSEAGALDTVAQIEKMGGRARAYKGDTRDIARTREIMDEFVSDFGRFDALINNSGITRLKKLFEIDEELFDQVIGTNIKGTYFTSQIAAEKMKKLGNGGVILNISSVHARGTWPGDTLYATTKAAICRMTEAMALDLAPDGIRVVCVAPGYIASGWEKQGTGIERKKKIVPRIPLGRFVEASEIGDACVFLVSDKASYITGSTLFVDGGILLPVVQENDYV